MGEVISEKIEMQKVMVSMFASSAIHRGFESRTHQTKDYQISICRFSAKHAALRSGSKDLLVWNQNVPGCGDMCIRGLLFQRASTINIPLNVLV
jgi:hypothetical protein